MANSTTLGAGLRQSSYASRLKLFTAAGINAVATGGLVLFDAVNAGALVVNDQADPVLAKRTRRLLDRLYSLQDALFGSSRNLPAAMAGVVELADDGRVVENSTAAPLSFFAPTGCEAAFFNVREGLTTEDALEGASTFLAAVGDLSVESAGNAGPVEGRQWATAYLVEMAKALVDSATLEMSRAKQCRGVKSADAKGGAL